MHLCSSVSAVQSVIQLLTLTNRPGSRKNITTLSARVCCHVQLPLRVIFFLSHPCGVREFLSFEPVKTTCFLLRSISYFRRLLFSVCNLCNRTGTCIPVCLVAFALRVLGLRPKSRTVFCESFCRVKSLSLSGRIMYLLADRFVVHWPELLERYPRAEYIGQLM